MCRECATALSQIKPCLEENSKYLASLYHEAHEEKKRRQVSMIGDVDEYFFDNSNTSLKVIPQVRNKVRITAAIFQLTSTGIVTIGPRTYNLSAGVYPWFGLHWILTETDIRKMTQQVQGFMSMELMGENMAETGVW